MQSTWKLSLTLWLFWWKKHLWNWFRAPFKELFFSKNGPGKGVEREKVFNLWNSNKLTMFWMKKSLRFKKKVLCSTKWNKKIEKHYKNLYCFKFDWFCNLTSFFRTKTNNFTLTQKIKTNWDSTIYFIENEEGKNHKFS